MRSIFILIICCVSMAVHAQVTTRYFDEFDMETDSIHLKTYGTYEWKAGEMHCSRYYANGQLKKVGVYTDTNAYRPNGTVFEYFEDGTLKSKWTFKDAMPMDSAFGYYPTGELYYYKVFKPNRVIKAEQFFDRAGNAVEKDAVHREPQFPGGQEALIKYLMEYTQYPKEARKEGLEGVTYIRFVVVPSGAVERISIIRSSHLPLDLEAIRVVESFPNWEPGMEYGEIVEMSFKLPFRFNLK